MQLILYYAPNACSLVPYVTLTEAGALFEVHPLNFRKSQHMTPEYLQLNPKHKVPVLVIDGAPLTENVAIQSGSLGIFRRRSCFPRTRCRNCMAHFERMKQRPSVRKLVAYEQEVQTAFAQAA